MRSYGVHDLQARVVGGAERIRAAIGSIRQLHGRFGAWRSRLATDFSFEVVARSEVEREAIHAEAKFLVNELQSAMREYQQAILDLQEVAKHRG
jgi:hypothetical protein